MKLFKPVKFWVFVNLCSILIWVIRWIPSSLERFYNIVFISWDYYPRVVVRGAMYSVAAIGMVARLIAAILGLVIICFIWKKTSGSFRIRKWVAIALAMESLYYFSLIPSVIWLFALGYYFGGSTYTLGFGYLVHILFTFPILSILAFKVKKYNVESNGFQLGRWIGIAFCGYIIALWANAVFRWFNIALAEGLTYLLGGSWSVLALNAFIFMSLAVVFAVFGTFLIFRRRIDGAIKWIGLSLIIVGLHYLIYVTYYFLIDSLNSVWLTDVWAITLLGLGISVLIEKNFFLSNFGFGG